MGQIPLTNAMREYLRAIYKVSEQKEQVTTTDIADKLQVSAASATTMTKKLDLAGYVRHTPYQGVTLTDEGRMVALRVLRRHRLLECFLKEVLKFSASEIHEESDRIEPHISESFEDRIDAVLDHPTVCPHGDPIPTKDGRIIKVPLVPLSEVAPGTKAIVRRVPGSHPDMLNYLEDLGIVLDALLTILDIGPFEGPVHVEVQGRASALSLEVCRHVHVEPITQPGRGSV